MSPVAFPAYADTEVALSSLDAWKQAAGVKDVRLVDASKMTDIDKLTHSVRDLIGVLKPDQSAVIDQINARLTELDEMRKAFSEYVERTDRRLNAFRAYFGSKG